MNFNIVIPARYASSRLPGKPLADIAGKPMIQWVYEQAVQAGAGKTVVATDDHRIVSAVEGFGGEAILTSPDHQSGTDRLQEVAAVCGLAPDDIVVNVQGDEPLIPPPVIRQVAENLAANGDAGVATLCEPIRKPADFNNPNIVKVVVAENGMALYFSRAPIPWPRDWFASGSEAQSSLPGDFVPRRHIGIYGYRVRELDRFVRWPVARAEALECLEQLRFLCNGVRIHVADAVENVPGGVDTRTDLQRVAALLTGEVSP